MSKVFEALRQSERNQTSERSDAPELFLGFQEGETFEKTLALQPGLISPHLVAVQDPRSLAAEKFRVLSTQLRQLQTHKGLKKLLVSSSVADDGKTTVAANLAVTLAATEQKVLLLAGDMRSPTLNEVLGLDHPQGLAEYTGGGRSLNHFIYRLESLKLYYLPAGNPPHQGLQLLQSGRISKLLAQLAEWFDWVIIDSPPLLPLADASMWARICDAVLLVVRDGRTPRKRIQKAVEGLGETPLLGVVLNDCTAKPDSYFERYSRQGSARDHRASTQFRGSV